MEEEYDENYEFFDDPYQEMNTGLLDKVCAFWQSLILFWKTNKKINQELIKKEFSSIEKIKELVLQLKLDERCWTTGSDNKTPINHLLDNNGEEIDIQLMKLFLEAKISPHGVFDDYDNLTHFHALCMHKKVSYELISLFLSHKASPNYQDFLWVSFPFLFLTLKQ